MSSFSEKLYSVVHTFGFTIARIRLWSRFGLISYMFLLHHMVFWVFGLPDITTAQTIIVGVILGLSTPITMFYIKSGQDLYNRYVNIEYQNKMMAIIDHIGFVVDKLRIFPLVFVAYYFLLLYLGLMWGMDLGDGISGQQAAFISTFSGSASLMFGFFVTTGETNTKIEQSYKTRYNLQGKYENRIVDDYDGDDNMSSNTKDFR